jgi:regulation of enolase protein 1 (concanavalin A-like superfamily)
MKAMLLGAMLGAATLSAEVLFEEPFHGSLKPGWSWVRENPKAWRVRDGVLEIRIEPGNMWGGENSGKNVLVRELPSAQESLEISLTVENKPTEQYEQVDLVAYFDDSHQVKIGQELVDGQLSIVMGREEKDRTRTIAIIPLKTTKVEVKWHLEGRNLVGKFRPHGEKEWITAGASDLPGEGRPRIAIQCYQGPKEQERWAKLTDFKIVTAGTAGTKP